MFKSLFNKYCFTLSLFILLGSFLVARLPYFLYSSVPEVATEDTMEYYEVVMKILSGQNKVDFSNISAGYPLFLLLIGLISNTIAGVVIAQNLLSLSAGVFFLYAINKFYPKLTLWAAIIFSGYFASEYNIHRDTILTPDTINASLLFLFSGLIIFSIKKKDLLSSSIASLVASYLIIVRSSGVVIIPILIALVIFMLINRYNIKNLAALVLPFILVLFFYSSYCYNSFGTFTFITVGRMAKKKENTNDKTKEQKAISIEDRKFINSVQDFLPPDNAFNLIRHSWEIRKVNQAYMDIRFGNELYLDSINRLNLSYLFMGSLIIDTCIEKNSVSAFEQYKKTFSDKFGHEKHYIFPEINANKFKIVTFLAYFDNYTLNYDFYNERYPWRWWFFYVGQCQKATFRYYPYHSGMTGKMIDDSLRIFGFKEMVNYPSKTGDDYEKELGKRNTSVIYKIYLKTKTFFFSVFFRNIFWIILFFVAFILSTYRLINTKAKDTDSFLVFIFCSINIGSALLFTFFAGADTRYSFTAEFTYYAVASLVPVLFFFKHEQRD